MPRNNKEISYLCNILECVVGLLSYVSRSDRHTSGWKRSGQFLEEELLYMRLCLLVLMRSLHRYFILINFVSIKSLLCYSQLVLTATPYSLLWTMIVLVTLTFCFNCFLTVIKKGHITLGCMIYEKFAWKQNPVWYHAVECGINHWLRIYFFT